MLAKRSLDPLTGCWNWTGTTWKSPKCDYRKGVITIRALRPSPVPIAKAYWLYTRGEIPSGFHVLHHCDNGLCFNPDHLYLGTQAQNCDDVARRGRRTNRKLTDAQVREVRAWKGSINSIAKRLGVSRRVIQCILRRENYRYVE